MFLFLMKYGVRSDSPFSSDGPVMYFESRPACLPGLYKPYPAPPGQSGPTIPQYIDWRPNKVNGLYQIPSRSREKVCMPLFLFFLLYNFLASTFGFFFSFFIHDSLGILKAEWFQYFFHLTSVVIEKCKHLI